MAGFNMGAFGENLRREREMRGVSLTEIAQATKIGTRMLDAIETERFDRLPGGIFNSAFVRQYSRYLGLDEDRVVAEFEAAYGSCAGKATTQTAAAVSALRSMASEAQRQEPSQPLPLLIAAGLLVAGTLAVGGWRLWRGKTTAQAPRPVAVVHSQPPAPTPAPAVPDTQAAVDPPPTDPAPKQAATTGSLQILLEASSRCSITVSSDGRPEWTAVMHAGDQRNLRAARIVQIQVDNAAALTVTRNGQVLPRLGDKGEPKTLTYKVDN